VAAKIEVQSGAALGLEYYPAVAVYIELINGQLNAYGPKGKLATRSWLAASIWLKMVNRKNRVELLASENGQTWQSLVTEFDASGFNQNQQHGGFQAARPALAASGSGITHFTDFHYRRF